MTFRYKLNLLMIKLLMEEEEIAIKNVNNAYKFTKMLETNDKNIAAAYEKENSWFATDNKHEEALRIEQHF